MILGKDLVLALNGTPLAAARSCSMHCGTSFLPACSPTDDHNERSIPERNNWNMSADALVATFASYKTLKTAWKNHTALTMRFYDTQFELNETGSVYIESLDIQGNVGSLVTMSVSLKGNGPISEYAGTTIPTTVEGENSNCYLTVDGDIVTWNNENGCKVELRLLTLTERTKIRVTKGDADIVIFTGSGSIQQPFDDMYDFRLSDYDATAHTEAWEEWVNAGEYRLMCSYTILGPTPTVYKLS